MRIARFKKGRLTAYGVVEGDEILEIVEAYTTSSALPTTAST